MLWFLHYLASFYELGAPVKAHDLYSSIFLKKGSLSLFHYMYGAHTCVCVHVQAESRRSVSFYPSPCYSSEIRSLPESKARCFGKPGWPAKIHGSLHTSGWGYRLTQPCLAFTWVLRSSYLHSKNSEPPSHLPSPQTLYCLINFYAAFGTQVYELGVQIKHWYKSWRNSFKNSSLIYT